MEDIFNGVKSLVEDPKDILDRAIHFMGTVGLWCTQSRFLFLTRPTVSVVFYSQMIGRGLRGTAIGGKESCLIINVKDNFINLPSIEKMYKVLKKY